eukprot:Partr_v1_DN28062_c1_g1_i1_m56773 putative RAB3 GTPase activating protein subunit 2 (Non-catalytic)
MEICPLARISSTVLILLGKNSTVPQSTPLVSFSQAGDYMVIGNSLCFFLLQLTPVSDPARGEIAEFRLVSRMSGMLEETETISALICFNLPNSDAIVSVAGYSSGNARFFNRKGRMLASRMFHQTRISSFCIRRSVKGLEDLELVMVHEGGVLVVVAFDDMYSVREALIDESVANGAGALPFKKWRVPYSDAGAKIVPLGPRLVDRVPSLYPNPAIYACSTSSSSSPFKCQNASAAFLRVGADPVVSYHHSHDSGSLLSANNLASLVTTSISSFAKSYFRSASSTIASAAASKITDQSQAIIAPTSLDPTLTFVDSPRQFSDISLAPPNYHLAALTDNFGRVWLLDTLNMQFIRLWKGIRDAQCSWLQYEDNDGRSLVMIMYAPKRNFVQSFRMRFGDRLDAISLESPGVRFITVPGAAGGKCRTFLLASDGVVSEIVLDMSKSRVDGKDNVSVDGD